MPLHRSLRPHRPWRRSTIVVLVVAAAWLLPACSGDDATPPSTTTPPTAPGASTTTAVVTTSAADPDGVDTVVEPVAVPYWIRGTVVGSGAARPLPPDVDKVRFALDQLLAGPTPQEDAAGLRTLIRADTQVLSFEVVDGVAKVGFNRAFQSEQTRPQVAQVVYTLTQFPEVTAVQFTVDGTPNGAIGVPPIARDDLEDITPEVLVERPTVDQLASGKLRFEGTAITVDGMVPWRLEGADGAVVLSGSDEVRGGAGQRGRFVGAMDLPPSAVGPHTAVFVSRDAATGAEKELIRIPVILDAP